ncbi:FtsQ-type POTRA domain-containing protein [Herbiconiux ginsengi]|nr:FtsQ-type POTRA domain-containing protein [Herbiconiux ginsengi]
MTVRDAETAPLDPLPRSIRPAADSSRAAAPSDEGLASPRADQPTPPARPSRRASGGTPWWTTPASSPAGLPPSGPPVASADQNATVPLGKKAGRKPRKPVDENAIAPLAGKPGRTAPRKPVDQNATTPLGGSSRSAGSVVAGAGSAASTNSSATSTSLPRPTSTGRAEKAPARAQSTLRAAVRERRRYEKSEARRFTQRSRRRRMAWLISGASVAALVVVVLLAAYSPLLAVRTVAVEGLSRLDPATVTTALDDQLGRPLALVDYGAIERDLAQFSYIESYSVEARPPDTLAVRIVERRPVAQLQTDAGFNLIDAAGVTVQQSPERIAGFPVLDLTGTEIGSPGFRAAAAVLMSLPDALITQVDRISGTTPDSVTMVFTGAGQRVVWGDAEDSDLKARILERLIATQDPSLPVEYDVSSPQSPVIR